MLETLSHSPDIIFLPLHLTACGQARLQVGTKFSQSYLIVYLLAYFIENAPSHIIYPDYDYDFYPPILPYLTFHADPPFFCNS